MDLALSILDGTSLRPGVGPIMSVTRAKFEQKGTSFIFFQILQFLYGWIDSCFASPIVPSFRRSNVGRFVTCNNNKHIY